MGQSSERNCGIQKSVLQELKPIPFTQAGAFQLVPVPFETTTDSRALTGFLFGQGFFRVLAFDGHLAQAYVLDLSPDEAYGDDAEECGEQQNRAARRG